MTRKGQPLQLSDNQGLKAAVIIHVQKISKKVLHAEGLASR